MAHVWCCRACEGEVQLGGDVQREGVDVLVCAGLSRWKVGACIGATEGATGQAQVLCGHCKCRVGHLNGIGHATHALRAMIELSKGALTRRELCPTTAAEGELMAVVASLITQLQASAPQSELLEVKKENAALRTQVEEAKAALVVSEGKFNREFSKNEAAATSAETAIAARRQILAEKFALEDKLAKASSKLATTEKSLAAATARADSLAAECKTSATNLRWSEEREVIARKQLQGVEASLTAMTARAVDAEAKLTGAEERARRAVADLTSAVTRMATAEAEVVQARLAAARAVSGEAEAARVVSGEAEAAATERAVAAEKGLAAATERAVTAEEGLVAATERAVAAEEGLVAATERAAAAEEGLAAATERAEAADERVAAATEWAAAAEAGLQAATMRAAAAEAGLEAATARALAAEAGAPRQPCVPANPLYRATSRSYDLMLRHVAGGGKLTLSLPTGGVAVASACFANGSVAVTVEGGGAPPPDAMVHFDDVSSLASNASPPTPVVDVCAVLTEMCATMLTREYTRVPMYSSFSRPHPEVDAVRAWIGARKRKYRSG